MNTTTLSLLSGLISGAITAVVAYFATRAKTRLELSVEYDKELHKSRLDAYKVLWPKMKPLARYSVERPVTYAIVKKTSEEMRDWYFEGGGIYLSRHARKPYFDMKAAMQTIIDNPELRSDPDRHLEDDDPLLKEINDFGTALRAALSDDIGTREDRLLKGKI